MFRDVLRWYRRLSIGVAVLVAAVALFVLVWLWRKLGLPAVIGSTSSTSSTAFPAAGEFPPGQFGVNGPSAPNLPTYA